MADLMCACGKCVTCRKRSLGNILKLARDSHKDWTPALLNEFTTEMFGHELALCTDKELFALTAHFTQLKSYRNMGE